MSERFSDSIESSSKLLSSHQWWLVDQRRGNAFFVHARNPSHALEVIVDNYDIDLSCSQKTTNISSCSDIGQSSLNEQFPDQVIISDLIPQHQPVVDSLIKSEASKTDNDQQKLYRSFFSVVRWLLD